MKKKLIKLVFIFSLLTAKAFGFKTNPDGVDDEKTLLIETSFFIPLGAEMVISGNLNVTRSNTLVNSGTLYFINTEQSDITFPSGNMGTGDFVFKGSEDYNLVMPEDPAIIENLTLEMQSGVVNLSGKLTIPNKLDLESGVLNVEKNSTLLIDNPAPSSVKFSYSPINKGYVSGYLTRKVNKGESYQFPVGNVDSFHPFLIDNPLFSDYIRVAFDENIPSECIRHCSNNSILIEDEYGWKVESESSIKNEFLAGLSLLNTPLESKSSLLEIYYLSDNELHESIIATNNNLNKSAVSSSYLTGNNRKSYGYYAFSNLLDDELANFLYVGNGNKTQFEIPNYSDFSNIQLKVYNRLGSMIFKSDHYGNEFDARNYLDGTYFYELKLERIGNSKIIRNFIDIKHEN